MTQQLVRFPDGSRALTDLYFPQFNLHLEIDEKFHEGQKEEDLIRELDIIQVTEYSITRIKITDQNKKERSLNEICSEVDSIIIKILSLKNEQLLVNEFCPWDFERRYSANSVIESGLISIKDNLSSKSKLKPYVALAFRVTATREELG
ncbi:AbaSI family restriction endonuclease [Vibrio aestuarianus]|uniref:AbaSI family restriction endonuclease n=1 Tax=Vibrio aestuarianus TaxID=28171 RepID=UPI0033BE54C0